MDNLVSKKSRQKINSDGNLVKHPHRKTYFSFFVMFKVNTDSTITISNKLSTVNMRISHVTEI